MKPWIQVDGYAADLQAAYDHFKKGGNRPAERFFERYTKCVAQITVRPLSCAVRQHGWRQKPIPRSTFSIFYGERGDYWMLVGVLNTIQDPDRIQAMLLIREVGTAADD